MLTWSDDPPTMIGPYLRHPANQTWSEDKLSLVTLDAAALARIKDHIWQYLWYGPIPTKGEHA